MIVFRDSDGFIEYAERTSQIDPEYDGLVAALKSKPTAPAGYFYKLKHPEMEWVLFEDPEPTDFTDEDKAEAYDILIGGAT